MVIRALEDFTEEVGIKEERNNYREEILKTKTIQGEFYHCNDRR